MEIIRFIFSSFWIWLGAVTIIYIPFETIVKVIRLLVRRSNISKHGWPPTHLDADGDWKKNE